MEGNTYRDKNGRLRRNGKFVKDEQGGVDVAGGRIRSSTVGRIAPKLDPRTLRPLGLRKQMKLNKERAVKLEKTRNKIKNKLLHALISE